MVQVQGDSNMVLLLCTHHSIMDGTSLQVAIDNLGSLYTEARANRPARLPEQPIQYSDYARWQRQQQEEGAWEPHVTFWKEQLAGAPDVLDLPSDVPDAGREGSSCSSSSSSSHWLHFQLDAGLVAGMRALATCCQASLLALLIAALQVWATRVPDLCLPSPLHRPACPDRSVLEGCNGRHLLVQIWQTVRMVNHTWHWKSNSLIMGKHEAKGPVDGVL